MIRYDEDEIYQELSAQYEKFLDLVGRRPTHIDSHLYIHEKFPEVNRQVIKFAEVHHLPVRGFATKIFLKRYLKRTLK